MLFHQLGEHLIFTLQFCLEFLDSLGLFALLACGIAREGGGTMFEKLFLPSVKNRWVKSIFVAEV